MTVQASPTDVLPLAGRLRLGPSSQSTPLPDWAAFLLHIGEHLACLPRTSPTTVALSVPTRHFAAAFVAAGAAFGCRHAVDPTIPDELFALPVGTYAMYYEGKWKDTNKPQELPGKITGKSKPGEPRSLVFGRNHSKYSVTLSEKAMRLLRPDPSASEKRNAASLEYRSDLHYALHQDCDSLQTLFAPRRDVLLVGVAATLREDLDLTVSAMHDGKLVDGLLNDLVHVCDWHPNGNCGFLGTQATGDAVPNLHAYQRYPVVVFDGPVGYQRWRDDLRHAHHVVIVDRTSGHLDTARTIVEDAHFLRDITGDDHAALPFPRPPGVEVLAFHRSV